jgi:hypothetical protein
VELLVPLNELEEVELELMDDPLPEADPLADVEPDAVLLLVEDDELVLEPVAAFEFADDPAFLAVLLLEVVFAAS